MQSELSDAGSAQRDAAAGLAILGKAKC